MQDTQGRRLTPPVLHLARRTARYWKLALSVLVLGLVATLLVAQRVQQIYRSEAVILYRQAARQTYGETDSSRRVGARLQDMVVARERLGVIARELNLYPEISNPDQRIDELKKRVSFRVRDGSTFVLSYDGTSPEMAQAVTARLTQGLLSEDGRQRAQLAEATRKLLEDERARFAQEGAAREEALSTFLRAHPELVLRAEAMAATTPMPLPPVPGAGALEAELARLRERQRELGVAPTIAPVSDGEAVAMRRRAEADLQQARRDLGERQLRYTDAHPDVMSARARVRLAETTLEQLTVPPPPEPARQGTSPEEAELATQIAALQKKISQLRRSHRANLPAVPSADGKLAEGEVQLQSLRYEVHQARQRLSGLEDKQFQAALLAKLETSGDVGQLTVLDPAYRPGLPFVDRKAKVTILGLALSLMLAVGAAMARALTDDRLFDRDDVAWLSSGQVLGVIPAASGRATRHAVQAHRRTARG